MLVVGNHVHTALRGIFEVDVAERTEEKLIELLRRAWRKDRAVFRSDRLKEKEWGDRAVAMLHQFIKRYDVSARPILLESFVEVPLGQHILWGRVDRVDSLDSQRVKIFDYKTGKLPRDVDFWTAQDLSAAVYAAGVARRLGKVTVEEVEYIFLAEAKSVKVQVEDQMVAAKLSDAKSMLQSLSSERTWSPRPGPYCRWCDFQAKCPEGSAHVQSMDEKVVEIVDDAELPF
jgi:putative RecB family exonuclease